MAEHEKKLIVRCPRKPSAVLLKSGIGITIVATIAWLLFNTAMKNWIVIGFGIRAFAFLRFVGAGAILVGILVTLCGSIPIIKWRALQKYEQKQVATEHQQQSQFRSDYAKDSANPELTRKRLRQLQQEIPSAGQLVERCLEQMDCIDTLQAKQDVLIETNDAQYLRKTVDVLNKVERWICRNFRNVINICIAADGLDDADKRKIERYLADNETKLQNVQVLLDASVDWINQYNADSTSDPSEVENWIAVIRESLKED